jgi:hypothetical protein
MSHVLICPMQLPATLLQVNSAKGNLLMLMSLSESYLFEKLRNHITLSRLFSECAGLLVKNTQQRRRVVVLNRNLAKGENT